MTLQEVQDRHPNACFPTEEGRKVLRGSERVCAAPGCSTYVAKVKTSGRSRVYCERHQKRVDRTGSTADPDNTKGGGVRKHGPVKSNNPHGTTYVSMILRRLGHDDPCRYEEEIE